ncbi:peptidase inhibitor family I36 protein [Streptomyces sp. NPDC060194]|uniref:peptidase inhibitor family I36 protein n=1 Tax=Streptomyces sp. NPDC060194 TaxID=3347069 RepID=UPI00364DC21B
MKHPVLAAAAVALTFTAVAAPASAADPAASCPTGQVCFYELPGFRGTPQLRAPLAGGCAPTVPARSVVNNSPHPVGLYVDEECTQYLDQVPPGASRSSLIAAVVTAE